MLDTPCVLNSISHIQVSTREEVQEVEQPLISGDHDTKPPGSTPVGFRYSVPKIVALTTSLRTYNRNILRNPVESNPRNRAKTVMAICSRYLSFCSIPPRSEFSCLHRSTGRLTGVLLGHLTMMKWVIITLVSSCFRVDAAGVSVPCLL